MALMTRPDAWGGMGGLGLRREFCGEAKYW
jgi:hypothetical protein